LYLGVLTADGKESGDKHTDAKNRYSVLSLALVFNGAGKNASSAQPLYDVIVEPEYAETSEVLSSGSGASCCSKLQTASKKNQPDKQIVSKLKPAVYSVHHNRFLYYLHILATPVPLILALYSKYVLEYKKE
jgi:hypothetical protein